MAAEASENCYEFKEILPETLPVREGDNLVEVFVGCVEPGVCGPLIKQLGHEFPLKYLSHLKRVRRRTIQESKEGSLTLNEDHSSQPASASNKRLKTSQSKKSSIQLEILIGSRTEIQKSFSDTEQKQKEEVALETWLRDKYKLTQVSCEKVPKTPPESKSEWQEWNAIWPTNFYPMKTLEYKTKELELSAEEIQEMILGIKAAVDDANQSNAGGLHNMAGTVVVSPFSKDANNNNSPIQCRVISRACLECRKQQEQYEHQQIDHSSSDDVDGHEKLHLVNPLATSILFAIQGMSRLEREMATRQGMDSADFQKGQYLCTGYDVYTTQEPTVFEAMSMVHARIRRLIFLDPNDNSDNQEDGSPRVRGLTEKYVHHLPGTNHKFRAFCCTRIGQHNLMTEESTSAGTS